MPNSAMTSDRRSLLRLIGPGQRGAAARLLVLMVASAMTESLGVMLLVPLLAAIGPGDPRAIALHVGTLDIAPSLSAALALVVALVALRSLINLARGNAILQFELGVIGALRRRAWRALLAADWRTLTVLRRSDSTSLLVTGIDRAGFGVNQAINGLAAAITLAGLTLAGLAIAPLVTLGGALGGLLVLAAYGRLRRRAALLGDRLGAAYAGMQGGISENLAAMRLVKSLGSETQAEAAAFAGFAELGEARIVYQRQLGLGQLALQASGAAVLAVLVWLAVVRWQLGAAAILPVVALFARSLPLLGSLQECWQHFAHARPAIDAAFALIDRAEAAREIDAGESPAPTLARELRLEGASVQFSAAANPALHAVSLVIPARSTAALVGASGAGKSTLADLLSGLIAADAGRFLIDGIEITARNRRAWRHRVGYVHQDSVLSAATLRDNLVWGRSDLDDTRLIAALRSAAADFALDLPQGLDTRLGDGGRVLSGGERQRIALARALLGQPDLLILDEATSALDPDSEAQVAAAIASLKGTVTMLVIAHRGRLTELADLTYQLEGGKLIS